MVETTQRKNIIIGAPLTDLVGSPKVLVNIQWPAPQLPLFEGISAAGAPPRLPKRNLVSQHFIREGMHACCRMEPRHKIAIHVTYCSGSM